jgi:hypothetical protein
MSVSLPFFTPSLLVGARQTLPVHAPLAQSLPTTHAFPSTHGGAFVATPLAPRPQSTSLSLPFFTPSVLVGARHAPSVPEALLEQTRLVQSRASAHALPSAHAGADAPPQSTSVSSPLRRPSAAVFG